MERVRLTIEPSDIAVPETFVRTAVDPGLPVEITIWNWNVASPPAGFLFRVEGDYRRFADVAAADPAVETHELFPISEAAAYCFLAGAVGEETRALFATFTRGSLLTVPPVRWNDDGTSTFALVGTAADVQAAVEGVPDGVAVTVEAVGGDRVASGGVVPALPPRQREAAETALSLGYYDVPREATLEDVAAALDCATATAGEHLRKAEGRVMAALFES